MIPIIAHHFGPTMCPLFRHTIGLIWVSLVFVEFNNIYIYTNKWMLRVRFAHTHIVAQTDPYFVYPDIMRFDFGG
jgi:hypothetical protein